MPKYPDEHGDQHGFPEHIEQHQVQRAKTPIIPVSVKQEDHELFSRCFVLPGEDNTEGH